MAIKELVELSKPVSNVSLRWSAMPADQSTEIGALDVIEERAAKGEISPTVAREILDDNPRRFYGL